MANQQYNFNPQYTQKSNTIIILSNGEWVHVAPGADPDFVRRIREANLARANSPKKAKKSYRCGKPRKSFNYAEGVLYKRNAFDDVLPFSDTLAEVA